MEFDSNLCNYERKHCLVLYDRKHCRIRLNVHCIYDYEIRFIMQPCQFNYAYKYAYDHYVFTNSRLLLAQIYTVFTRHNEINVAQFHWGLRLHVLQDNLQKLNYTLLVILISKVPCVMGIATLGKIDRKWKFSSLITYTKASCDLCLKVLLLLCILKFPPRAIKHSPFALFTISLVIRQEKDWIVSAPNPFLSPFFLLSCVLFLFAVLTLCVDLDLLTSRDDFILQSHWLFSTIDSLNLPVFCYRQSFP